MYYDYEQYIGNGIKFEKQLQSSVGEFGCAQATPKPQPQIVSAQNDGFINTFLYLLEKK